MEIRSKLNTKYITSYFEYKLDLKLGLDKNLVYHHNYHILKKDSVWVFFFYRYFLNDVVHLVNLSPFSICKRNLRQIF